MSFLAAANPLSHLHFYSSHTQVRPGKQTAEYVTETLTSMSLLGSVFLGESYTLPG